MKTHDLKNMSREEIAARLFDTQKEYLALQQAVQNGKEKNHSKLKITRKLIAQLKTFHRHTYDQ